MQSGPSVSIPSGESDDERTRALGPDHADVYAYLTSVGDTELDGLDFGVIGFDADTIVRRYNAFESRCAGLDANRVIGHPLFTVVAPCMNNYLVAQRFEDAATIGVDLDETLDYVLTLRMRPVKVRLRLLACPTQSLRYLLVSGRPPTTIAT